MAQVLQMIFKNQNNRNFTISIDDPRQDLTGSEVKTAMDTIVSKNVFQTTGGDVIEAAEARIIDTQIVELELE